jgi:hypothetical protein
LNTSIVRKPLPGNKIAAKFQIFHRDPPPLNPAGKNKPQMTALFFAFIIDAQHASDFGHAHILSLSDMSYLPPLAISLWECGALDQ